MKKTALLLLSAFIWAFSFASLAGAEGFGKVEQKLTEYDREVDKLSSALGRMNPNPRNKEWVKKKLDVMFQIDQYTRRFMGEAYSDEYSDDEKREFTQQMNDRMKKVLSANTADLKKILEVTPWIKVSEYGAKADNQAWLLVSVADQDLSFQKKVLGTLEKLWGAKETSPRNYAHLYDHLAVREGKPQKFGTQGRCTGPGKWEPMTVLEPEKLNERRGQMGMESIEDYAKRFAEVCK